MQIFTLLFMRVLKTCWTDNSFFSCVNTSRLGVSNSRIFISGWVLWGDSRFAPDLNFCLVNTISNVWSSLYYPLRFIVLCYRPWLVLVSEMSSHYQCCYLMLDMLRLSMLQTTYIKIKPKYCIFLVKSLYIQITPQLFSTVSITNKLRWYSAPNSHNCKLIEFRIVYGTRVLYV